MGNIKRAIEFTEKVAQRYNLAPPFSKVLVGKNGEALDGIFELRIDMPALKSFLGPLAEALKTESEETRDMVTSFVRLVNQIQEDPGQEFSKDWIN
jgi:hypothetical protein